MEETHHRGLSTARAVLQVEWLLAREPEGVRADQVAAGAREERLDRLQPARQPRRGGRRHPAPGQRLRARPRLPAAGLRRTRAARPVGARRRSAGAHAQARLPRGAGGRVTSAWWSSGASRGCSSCPAWDRRSATTPMPSRSARSCSPSLRDEAVERYIQAGLRGFTASTITRPDALRAELRRIRRTGVATDCEEFDAGLLLSGRPGPRPPPPLRRRRRHLDDAPRVRGRARGARGDPPRRGQIPAICGKAATFLNPIPARS